MRRARVIVLLCLGLAACPEGPSVTPEVCDNRVDDDDNGKVDCLDPECVSQPACAFGERCDNGADDNANTLVDCADPLCDGRSCGVNCVCDGGRPDAGSVDAGSVDAGAPGVDAGLPVDSGTPPVRDSGVGDSGVGDAGVSTQPDAGLADAGRVDAGLDAGTDAGLTTVDAGFPPESACADGLDNDHDGLTDCADPDCLGAGLERCADGIDNTCDRAIDCGDPKCIGDPACRALGDGAACAADSECAGSKCLTEAATGHPNGACTSSPSCDVAFCQTGLCAASREGFVCRALCTTSGPGACRPGYACDDADEDPMTFDTLCVPLCVSDLDCSVSADLTYGCNPISKRCEPKSRGLSLYGADCTTNAQCESGQCTLTLESNGLRGSCTGLCRNDLTNCGPGGLCTGDAVSLGDNVSLCLQGCTDSSQCRAPGYQCRERTPGEPGTQVCACAPLGDSCSQGLQCCSGRCFHAQCESL